MQAYDHKKLEKKWQTIWEKNKIYQAKFPSKMAKFYSLVEFPYPSGDGLHIGHPRPYIGMDIISRKRRMEGYNVLYPMGWDAFGLPTENYAIKTGLDPRVVTKRNSDTFRRQIKSLGISFDWSREINTTDPKYYKWTQWIFLQFFKKSLAYKAKMTINWCPKDKIGLANEEVVNGACERCGTPVEKREKEQWMLAITKYADRLDKDLDTVDYLPHIKLAQKNWIGKSEGAEIDFKIKDSTERVKIFTTRADTIFGAFAVILAPEHALVQKLKSQIKNFEEVEKYIKEAKKKTEIERTDEKSKSGIELKGLKAINPINNEEISVWIADFILVQYGTGAVFADMHDERDFEFAKKYKLPMRQSVMPLFNDKIHPWIDGKKIVEREAIHAIIRKNNGDILVLYWKGTEEWKKNAPITFLIGGVKKGENLVEAAKREIKEETGFFNLKFVEQLSISTQSRFFAAHKNVNRIANVTCLVFDLMNEERVPVSEKETKFHDWKFVPMTQVLKDINIEDDKLFYQYIQKPSTFVGEGVLVDSGKYTGMLSNEARSEIIKAVNGKVVTKFKLRDWVFSRQRYWGEPIPIIHCDKCGYVPVPEKDLPVELPKVKNYQPTDTGESPLANISKWVNVKCPKCKGPAKRETDTMPNWAGSSWYYLRYTDPKNSKIFADKKNLKYWTPVDWYNGGNEHTTLHLLYSRFWHKFLFDLKLVPTSEPYLKRTSHGIILAEGGEKMSKSRGNVINPDTIVKTYGADTLRLYEMFMGPFDQAASWSDAAIIGPRRFLERIWKISEKVKNSSTLLQPQSLSKEAGTFHIQNSSLSRILNETIKKVSEDIEAMRFNTAVSALMIFVNEAEKSGGLLHSEYEIFLKLLAPFAPHISEELWHLSGHKQSIHWESWPAYDRTKLALAEVTIVVQVNGKVRGQFEASGDISESDAIEKAQQIPEVKKWLSGQVKRYIFIPRKIVNIVI